MSKDRFTEKDETGRMAVMLDQNNQLLIEYSEIENKDGSKTCTPTMVYAPFIDRLAQYEDLIFSPETLKAIIAEWKEWADAKNDGRMTIIPKENTDSHAGVSTGSE